MMRIIPALAVAFLAASAIAQGVAPTTPKAVEGQNVSLGPIKIIGDKSQTNAVEVRGTPQLDQDAPLILSRTFLDAVQGNVDRETTEFRNGEVN